MSESTNDRLSDIVGIRLRGGLFNVPTDLTFFPSPQENQKNKNKSQKPQKDVIIYGRNGAGKSTIARAIKSIAGEWQPTIQDAQFFDKNHQPIILNEDERKRIFVFDEEFIDKNIKFRQQGLDTIIMVGAQVDLEKKIAEKEQMKADLKTELTSQKKIVDEYKDCDNEKSPVYWHYRINEALRGPDNWAGRNKKINLGIGSSSKVNDDTYKNFMSLHPLKSRDTLLIEFNEGLKDLSNISRQEINDSILKPIPPFELHYDEAYIQALLLKKIERPVVSEREKALIALGFQQLNDLKNKLVDPDVSQCPYCLQKFPPNYKEELIKDIEYTLHKAGEEHRNELIQCKYEIADIGLSDYSQLPSCEECKKLYTKLKAALQNNNEKIIRKCDDPYTPITENIDPVIAVYHQLVVALQHLEEERKLLCDKQSTIKHLQNDLRQINNEIAYYDIRDIVKQFEEHHKDAQIACEKYQQIIDKTNACQKELSHLEAQRKNITIALDLINGYLKYIFFSNDRFKITVQGNSYVLLSNGQSVTPSQISTGERNIIALCYFFAHIMQNQDPAKACKNDYLLVIDDPVSSFDLNNRVGITSFLAFQLRQFLNPNSSTRAVIMTHSLQVYYDMKQIVDDIWGNTVAKKAGYELVNQQLQLIADDKKRHEYAKLISIIFNYANGAPDTLDSYDLSIGNMMRQVLEAFSTFQYQKGITKIISDPDISAILDKKNVGPYFEGLMYRLILHGESHTEIKVKTMQNMEFLPSYSQEEKQKIAKSVLCLIYLLAPKHLLAHLQSEQEKEEKKQQKQEQAPRFKETLEKWFQEIREENPSIT